MKLDINQKQPDHLVPTAIVHQTAFWGRVHQRLGFTTEAFDLRAGASEHGDFLVVRVPLADGIECAYVPFGPELAPAPDQAGLFLERLSRELQPLLGPRCAFVRWDLPWTSVHAREPQDFASDGEWNGPPEERLRELRMNIGTEDRSLYKAPRDLLPADTVLVDLGGTEEELLARMHSKTRYNLRLAERRGVVVETGTRADLAAWYEMYVETLARNEIDPMPFAHFEAVLDERGEGSTSPVHTRLLLARYEGQLLAGMLLAIAPERATYLYGASTRAHREHMAPTALQWEAIRAAKAHGCADYDMFGSAPGRGPHHPLAGVHRFKVGFGGELVHREGCWDFPFDEDTYDAWRRAEKAHVVQRSISAT